jgi:hypothetical protein
MAAISSDIELSKYWSLLKTIQKESLLAVIDSFILSSETKEQELNEPAFHYKKEGEGFPIEILKQLTWEQKQAVMALVESFGIEIPGQHISIEQYNKEIDEAMARIDAGEFYTHEEVVEMSKTRVNDK